MTADNRTGRHRRPERQQSAAPAATICSPAKVPENTRKQAKVRNWHGNCSVLDSGRKECAANLIATTLKLLRCKAQPAKGNCPMSIYMQKRTPEFVEKLTVAPNVRRQPGAQRRSTPLCLLPLLLTLIAPGSPAQTPDWQPVEEIAAAAEAFLKARTGVFAGNTTVQARNIDPRQRLALCDQALDGFLRSGTEIKARTIVGVRCSGSKPWKVYVPVDVIVTETVLIARKTLNKGHVLTAADIIEEARDVSRLRNGYMSDPANAVGQRLKTQLIAGKIVVPTMFEVEIAVRRGQTVTLTAGSGDFSIAMTGTALMNGAINQRIRVENTHSGRVVEGIVRSREHVEVLTSSNKDFFHAEPKVSGQPADTHLSNNDS